MKNTSIILRSLVVIILIVLSIKMFLWILNCVLNYNMPDSAEIGACIILAAMLTTALFIAIPLWVDLEFKIGLKRDIAKRKKENETNE